MIEKFMLNKRKQKTNLGGRSLGGLHDKDYRHCSLCFLFVTCAQVKPHNLSLANWLKSFAFASEIHNFPLHYNMMYGC
ncbi:hypothetical protein HanIR_Chr17g0885001 [Helianthus annuus]|nr:hypothetical protein HanIR_Chr17g0885001 [Helianthus annuus]